MQVTHSSTPDGRLLLYFTFGAEAPPHLPDPGAASADAGGKPAGQPHV